MLVLLAVLSSQSGCFVIRWLQIGEDIMFYGWTIGTMDYPEKNFGIAFTELYSNMEWTGGAQADRFRNAILHVAAFNLPDMPEGYVENRSLKRIEYWFSDNIAHIKLEPGPKITPRASMYVVAVGPARNDFMFEGRRLGLGEYVQQIEALAQKTQGGESFDIGSSYATVLCVTPFEGGHEGLVAFVKYTVGAGIHKIIFVDEEMRIWMAKLSPERAQKNLEPREGERELVLPEEEYLRYE